MKSGFVTLTGMVLLLLISCTSQKRSREPILRINPAHLNYLYQERVFGQDTVGFVRIYAEAPDYHYVEAPGEGIACVDDAARAAVFYMQYYSYRKDPADLLKARRLLRFVLHMQAPNGMFYNFVFEDGRINRTRHNSRPVADWWGWRAMWALSEGALFFRHTDTTFAGELTDALEKALPAVDSLLIRYPRTRKVKGLPCPIYLPFQSAADQASVLVQALVNYIQIQPDSQVSENISRLCQGICLMQTGDSLHFPYGVLRSWENQWHAWGNSQSYALLKAARLPGLDAFAEPALQELRFFVPLGMQVDFSAFLSFRRTDEMVQLVEKHRFPQIAYGIRPYVWAALEAFRWTGCIWYARAAGKWAAWLVGENPAGVPMYQPATGRCFDGLESETVINRNSGAESTIEALLTLLKVRQVPAAWEQLQQAYRKHLIKVSSSR